MEFENVMKVLIVGGSGREHALAWKIAQSPLVSELYVTPGNPGIAQVATCLEGDPFTLAKSIGADFVVVGPEAPLAAGLVNRLNSMGIAAFGPNKAAAQLEASKDFCKQLLKKYAIPTADFQTFTAAAPAKTYLKAQTKFPLVVKADGLAAGKGVIIAQNRAEALEAVDALFAMQSGVAAPKIVVEEFLEGEEVSLIALTDGENLLPLVPAQDHKRVGEGDAGPNTGGMGCYSPVPALTLDLYNRAVHEILQPTLAALRAEGIEYRGALYAGLMLTADGPKVLEYNCRFGDPETQVILPRLKSDLLPLLLACAGIGHKLNEWPCEWTTQTAVCVVMASQGYPGDYRKGDPISGLDAAHAVGAEVFHAGTKADGEHIVTSGGRVLGVTALGDDFAFARAECYRAVAKIHFDGAHFRRDIGWRCL